MKWDEPGRHVADDGSIVYHWPPEGRFAEVWKRIDGFTDEEKSILLSLLRKWQQSTSILISFTNEHGDWEDVDWTTLEEWS